MKNKINTSVISSLMGFLCILAIVFILMTSYVSSITSNGFDVICSKANGVERIVKNIYYTNTDNGIVKLYNSNKDLIDLCFTYKTIK